jgi:germination protein M
MKRIVASTAMLLLTGAIVLAPRTSPAAAPPTSLSVYLVSGEHVAPVRRTVPHTVAPARAALAALLRGPSAAERAAGITTAIPPGTPLRGVSLAHGVLLVDVGRRFESGGGSLSMLLRVAQVVHTATQFPGVRRVAFALDGRRVTAIGGEGVIVSPPVGRTDVEGQAPPILVESPLPGDRVPLPLVVRGTAAVFEGQFVVDVVTPRGALLARRNVTASAGAGPRGAFGVRIPLRTHPARVVVVAYDRSPRDGARIGVVRIPVMLG